MTPPTLAAIRERDATAFFVAETEDAAWALRDRRWLLGELDRAAEKLRAICDAAAEASKYLGCGDNSCNFESVRGVGTNGGCSCVRSGRPFSAPALAALYKAARALAPTLGTPGAAKPADNEGETR